MDSRDVMKAFEKAVKKYNERAAIKKELNSCEKQIKDVLGIDVKILTEEEYKDLVHLTVKREPQLSYKDIKSLGRIKSLDDGKICTVVSFTDGTETKVVLNQKDDYDDPEKAVMWCLLKKCFSSKRGLEKVIYGVEELYEV